MRQRLNAIVTELRCTACGLAAVHTEVWEGDDEPQGLALEERMCDCGRGVLIEDRRDGVHDDPMGHDEPSGDDA